MEFLGNWIVGISAAALIFSAVLSLAPEGGPKRVVRLAGGGCVLLAMLMPLGGLDASAFSPAAFEPSETYAEASAELRRTNYDLQKIIIEQRLGSYIQAKADVLGLDLTAEVCCSDRNGSPFPDSIIILYDGDPASLEPLRDCIESDLGISRSAQTVRGRNQ